MDQDELFVQGLRARADAAVPRVDVDVDRVVPRARRRRRVVRGAAGATTLALVLGATWGASAVLGVGPVRDAPPAGLGTGPSGADPAATAAPTPDADARPTVPADAVVADDGTVTGVPGDPWDGPDRYWYTLTESSWGYEERNETWSSRERPGLNVTDGDLSTAWALSPRPGLGSWVIGGVRYEQLADPRFLPTDPAELAAAVRAGLLPDRGEGTDDDKVFDEAVSALGEAGLYPRDLRAAFWGVLASLPGSQVDMGEDGRGRTGEVLTRVTSGGQTRRLVRDAATGLLLEQGYVGGGYTRYLEQRTRDDIPLEPTLEMTGCPAWC